MIAILNMESAILGTRAGDVLMVMTVIFSLLTLLLILLILAIVVLPAIIAFNRRHRYKWVILALTIIGGWTGIVWIAALVWALMPNGRLKEDPPLEHEGKKASSWSPMVQEPEGALLESRRRVSGPLILGIVLLPLVFAWFTLRKGHSTISRIASIGYAVVFTLMSVYALTSWLTGLADRAVTDRANAENAVANHMYLVTTVDNVAKVLENGRDEDYRRRILYMDGTITSMKPQSGHTEIVLQGEKAAEITLNGDYLVGLKPGDKATAACVSIMRIGPIKELAKCMVAPQGSLPLPGNTDIKYDAATPEGGKPGPAVSAPAEAKPADNAGNRKGFAKPRPDQVIPFGQPIDGNDASGGNAKDNPFAS